MASIASTIQEIASTDNEYFGEGGTKLPLLRTFDDAMKQVARPLQVDAGLRPTPQHAGCSV